MINPVAGLDRRFYAFVLDRFVSWGTIAVAVVLALPAAPPFWLVAAVVAAAALVVWIVSAVLLGTLAWTPGLLALGLRVVSVESGAPLGVGPALLRVAILGLATIPTLGLGLATLAWTALVDPGRRRRGWHDRVTGSIVLDVRPRPVEAPVEEDAEVAPVVNLTALRLVPVAAGVAGGTSSRAGGSAGPVVQDRTSRRPAIIPAGPAAGWLLTFDTGQRVRVEGRVLVGRQPQARPGESVRDLVALPSEDLSLSKTHAQVDLAPDGTLVVTDRGSTNGSMLTRRGVSRPLTGGRPVTLLAGDLVRLGDRRMEVGRQADPVPRTDIEA